MQNTYLKEFNNLFYDVENNDKVKNIVEQTSCVFDLVITRFGRIECEMAIGISRIDDFVIILFIRKIMEQLDSLNVLYSVCLFEPAHIILRALIENIIELEFILKDDTEKRAAAYYLEYHFQELDKSEFYSDPESEYGKLFISQKGKNEFDRNCDLLKKKRKAIEQLIRSKTVFQEIDKARKSSKCRLKKWYNTCSNIKNFRELMEETGYERQYYEAIYGGLSFETHGLNAALGVNVDGDGYSLKYIRNPENGGCIFELACIFSISVLDKIYQYLDVGESKMAEFKSFCEDFKEKRDVASANLDKIRRSTPRNFF